MGQKVNPIAVRLNFNRLSDYNWFSDYYYSTLFFQDINLQQYLNKVKQPNSNKLGFRVGKCIIHRLPKKSFIHLFCLSDQRSDSSFRDFSISLNSETIHRKKDRLGYQQKSFSQGPLGSTEDQAKKKLKYSFSTNRYFTSSIFWLNSPTQQKKRALINLFRDISNKCNNLTEIFFSAQCLEVQDPRGPGPRGVDRGSTEVRRGQLRAEGQERQKSKTEDFFFSLKTKSGVVHENPKKIISENKKFWNKKYNFQILLTGSHSVSNLDVLKNKLLHKGLEHTDLCFNFYTMYYYFMQKINIFDLDVYNVRRTIKFLSKNKNGNFSSLGPGPKAAEVNPTIFQQERLSPQTDHQIVKVNEANPKIYNKITESILDSDIKSRQSIPLGLYGAKPEHFNKITRSLDFSLSKIRNVLSFTTNTSILLRPLKIHSIFHSANLVAQEVACKLEQKKSFRLICRLIFQQLILYPSIKGIRITCSGRINGAEIAKTECRKFGETSLHVFSNKIDYAQAIASTPYGILGVKVWISFI